LIPIQQANVDPLLQYLNSPDFQQDYPNYDFSGPESFYTDSDGTWYDDAASDYPQQQRPSEDFLASEPTDQDVALAKLMLDHMAGKYSLEDLETLEREARIEENTENQLRSLAKEVRY